MAKLSDEVREGLRTLTVEVLLALRREYLRAGASPLRHWEQLASRARSAARRAESPDEWVTLLQRGLQITSVGLDGCRAILALGAAVRELGAEREWLELWDYEAGLLLAMTRLAAERQKEGA